MATYVRALAVTAILGLGGLFLLTWTAQAQVRVNGPLYRTIVADKDLEADILPPPLYVVESYVQALRLATEEEQDHRDEEVRYLTTARKTFVDGIDRRIAAEGPGPVHDELVSSRAIGVDFYDATDELLAAVKAHDAARQGLALERAERSFVLQRAANAKVVSHLEERMREHEALAADRVRSALVTAVILLLLVAAVIGVTSFLVVRVVASAIRRLREASAHLGSSVQAGRLAERVDEGSIHPDFAEVATTMNQTMDAFVVPFRETSAFMTRLSRGDLPEPITEPAPGELEQIRVALNTSIASVKALVSDASLLAQAGMEGRLSVRADATRHHGDFRRVIEGVNGALDAVTGPLREASACVDAIARGEIPDPIAGEYRGDFEVLKRNLNLCIESVEALVADARALSSAAVAGQLGVRGDPERHHGDFRAIIQGVNAALDAIVAPFRVVASYCERLSHGDLPPLRTSEGNGAVQGEIVPMRASLNRCVQAITHLVEDVTGLVDAAIEGRLDARIELSRHEGAFREALAGVNRTLETVLAPVQESAGVLARLAERDLRARVEGEYRGDHARIQEALNSTGEALQGALVQVASVVGQVSSAATQIASSSQAVAAGASEQASALSETTSTVETLSDMTQQSSARAQEARALVTAARGAAGDGAAAVEQLQEAMGKIRSSAEATSQIIRDVSDIAFQTNLLALNAAVEAARAGEAGRGFAVVAEEVRSLALRAKDAATRTEALIRQSVLQAGEGETAAHQVTGKLSEIAQGVSRATDLVTEIAAAAQEQATGIRHVQEALSEMDKVTQQNATSAEESSSAASELSGQAQDLAGMVASFRLGSGAEPDVPPARRLAAERAQRPRAGPEQQRA